MHQMRNKIYFLIAVIYITISFVLFFIALPPRLTGDGWEYSATLQALFDHTSPNVHEYDFQQVGKILGQPFPENQKTLFVRNRYGSYTGVHFWLYSLCSIPAKLARIIHE